MHNGFSKNELKDYFNWTEIELKKRMEVLLKEELIYKKDDEEFSPTFMVISLEEGEKLFEQSEEFVDQAVMLILQNIDEIKCKTKSISSFEPYKFEDLSLFILSDVLLDAIQIDNVEKEFLKSERTKRNSMNYYYSIQEKNENSKKEAFGIYGNMSRQYGNIEYCLYGNKRYGDNFCTIDSNFIMDHFSYSEINDILKTKEELLNEIVKVSKYEEYQIEKKIKNGFSSLGIMNNNKINIPILNKDDYDKLNDIANIIKCEYLNIFEEGREKLYSYYQSSSYFKEISFKEYFLWWYHFFYTRVTDVMIEKGVVLVPDTNNFHYIVALNNRED